MSTQVFAHAHLAIQHYNKLGFHTVDGSGCRVMENDTQRVTIQHSIPNSTQAVATLEQKPTCTCQICETKYNKKDVERIYGESFWTGKYCSALCYTTSLIAK